MLLLNTPLNIEANTLNKFQVLIGTLLTLTSSLRHGELNIKIIRSLNMEFKVSQLALMAFLKIETFPGSL